MSQPPETWDMPPLDRLRAALAAIPPADPEIAVLPARRTTASRHSRRGRQWRRRRSASGGRPRLPPRTPNTALVDFMIASPITRTDDNFWDPHHYRIGIADRIIADLARALRGETSDDYRILALPRK